MLETEAFSISRDLKAPRALVYEVQTDAKHSGELVKPGRVQDHPRRDGFPRRRQIPLRPRRAGRRRKCGACKDFVEIVPNEKIVLIQSFSDKDGGLTRHPMAPEWPLEMLSTTTFEDIAPGMTRITISWRPYNSDEAGIRAFDAGRAEHDGRLDGAARPSELGGKQPALVAKQALGEALEFVAFSLDNQGDTNPASAVSVVRSPDPRPFGFTLVKPRPRSPPHSVEAPASNPYGSLHVSPARASSHFGSLSARIPSLRISGGLAKRSPALAFSIKAAATFPLRCASRPSSSSKQSNMANEEGPS